MRDTPTSDELIKRAKRDFAPTVYSRTYTVISRSEDIEKMVEETMNTDALGDAMAEVMAEDSATATSDSPSWMMPEGERRSPTPPRGRPSVSTPSEPVPASPYPAASAEASSGGGGSAVLRAVGWFLILAMAGLWALLLIGAAGDPDNAGSVIGGGIVLTAIPLFLAFLLLRAARKPKQPGGLIS